MSRKGDGRLNLEILTGFPGGSPLVRDYLRGESHLARFFEGDFRDSRAFLEKAREVDGRFHGDARERVAAMVHSPSGKAGAALEGFVRDGGYVVTTGQQPGLFAGPLYSLCKALTAVKLAETLEGVLGRPVLPLFWVASEDHDWEEADHTVLLDQGNELRTLRLPPQEGSSSSPLWRIPLTRGLEEAVDELREILPNNDFSDTYFELIQSSYAPGATLPQGFRRVLEGLLSDLPIFFVDAHDPTLKAASTPLLLEELERSAEHEALLLRVASHLEMEGYGVQVPILDGGVNLFMEGPSGRDRIYRDGSVFRLHHAGLSLSLDEIRDRCQADPGILSPNVLLRPVVESALFPTLAYVAGPGETAYFAQLREYFHVHGIRMPVIYPRHSVTFVEGKVGKVLEKFRLSVEGLNRPFHEIAAEIAREEVPTEVRRALGEIRGAVGKGAGTLTKAAQDIDPTLKGPIAHARNASFGAFDEAERKILQAVKRQNEIALGQLEKAQRNLFPFGKPQERVLNPFYYYSRYGPELTPELLKEFRVALEPHSA